MQRFLIEVPHEAETIACIHAVQILLQSGSHFITHADFGCRDGDHRAWIVIEGDSKAEVRNVVPLPYRAKAQIVALNKFTLEELDALAEAHRKRSGV